MYGFFKWFPFLNKATVIPFDTVSEDITNHEIPQSKLNLKQVYITTLNIQLEMIDNFFKDLQSKDTTILLNSATIHQYMNDVEITYNALNMGRNFSCDYKYFTTIAPLPFY